jgi:hypothetical protein
MNIATVVEGLTDRMVLKEAINCLVPGDHCYFDLQPTGSGGETGAGWKGVRRWCRETWQRHDSSLEKIISEQCGLPLNLLVIQLDADTAAEADLQDGLSDPLDAVCQPCPPVQATVDRLRHVLLRWLNRSDEGAPLPPQVVLAFPAQDVENWTFAALFPNDPLCAAPDYECTHRGFSRRHPAYLLTLDAYGKHLRRKGGEIKKPKNNYDPLLPAIKRNWPVVRGICSQAEALSQQVLQHLGSNSTQTNAD